MRPVGHVFRFPFSLGKSTAQKTTKNKIDHAKIRKCNPSNEIPWFLRKATIWLQRGCWFIVLENHENLDLGKPEGPQVLANLNFRPLTPWELTSLI